MAAALDTFCPHLPKGLAFLFACVSQKLLKTIKRTSPDYSITIAKEKMEDTLDFDGQRGLRKENL